MLDNYSCNLILLFVNRMSTHGRIEGRIERLYKLLDKADKIYPRYLKNSKNSRRLNTVIRKLHKKLNKTRKNINNSSSKQREQNRSDISEIELAIRELTSAIKQIKQQQENYHIKSLINPRGHYSNSRLGSIMNILQRSIPVLTVYTRMISTGFFLKRL
jgi:hypothetical protein